MCSENKINEDCVFTKNLYFMKNQFFCFVFLGIHYFAQAQNLIVNPSFEELKEANLALPCQYMRQGDDFAKALVAWQSHRSVTADVLSVEKNRPNCFPMEAHQGQHMAGFIAYHPHMDSGYSFDYHEVIEGSFQKNLNIGQRYVFSFWLYADDSLAYKHLRAVLGNEAKKIYATHIDSLGIRFSTSGVATKIHCSKLNGNPNYAPQAMVRLSPKKEDKGKWLKYQVAFVADSAYRYFALGNFKKDENTKTSLPLALSQRLDSVNLGKITKQGKRVFFEKSKRIAYYAVDDFSLEASDAPLIELSKEKPFTFQNLQFEQGKAEILPSSYAELNAFFDFLQIEASQSIVIQGHTDDIDNKTNNLSLSQKRAEAVASYLIKKGFDNKKLQTKGFGESQPIVPNDSESNRAKNRRVEVGIN
jgi:outer membrane protein OmpA-like peptidoglycan-associated protein